MRTNPVKQKIQARQPSYGIGVLWPSTDVVEFCGYLGFEWLFIDVEHGQFDLQTLAETARAAELSGMVPLARVPKVTEPEALIRVLETGVMGIIAAHVSTGVDAENAVKAVKYPPVGVRSAGVLRPARYGIGETFAEYTERFNRESMVVALVEDEEGLRNIDEILAVDGLDGVVIGYGDLSLVMGYPGAKAHPEVLRLANVARERIVASGKALQVTVQSGKEARTEVESGALLVRCSVPSILGAAAKAWLKEAKGEGGGAVAAAEAVLPGRGAER